MERQLSGRVAQYVLRNFEHVERTDEECMAKKVMFSDVEGNRRGGRPRLGWMDGWMDGVRMALGERGMSVEQGRLSAF